MLNKKNNKKQWFANKPEFLLFLHKGSIPGAQGSYATDDAQLLGTLWRTHDAQYNRWETAQSRPGRTG